MGKTLVIMSYSRPLLLAALVMLAIWTYEAGAAPKTFLVETAGADNAAKDYGGRDDELNEAHDHGERRNDLGEAHEAGDYSENCPANRKYYFSCRSHRTWRICFGCWPEKEITTRRPGVN